MLVLGIILEFLIFIVHYSYACEKSDGICCFNHFKEDNICKECPAGTFGFNCSGKCVSGYYGKFCIEACNCSSHLCDTVHGCRKNNKLVSSSTALHVTPLPTDDIQVWQKTFFSLMGCILMVFVAAGFLHYKSRKKKRRQAGNFQKTDSHALSAEHNDQTASLVTVDIPPMTDTARDTDIYADIRSSQMMESQSQALPKGNNLSIQTEEELMDLTIGYDGDYRNILASHSCGRSKEDDILKADKQENDYGIFEESCQYSVLSLRRNFDPSEMECYAVKQSLRRQLSHNNDDPYCLTNVWIYEDHRSLDDCDSDSDVSLSSKHSEDASQKSNRPQTQDGTQSFN